MVQQQGFPATPVSGGRDHNGWQISQKRGISVIMKKKNDKNYLDYIPVKNPEVEYLA